MKKREEAYRQACIEMFRRVNIQVDNFEEILAYAKAHGELWYLSKEWTLSEQNEFKEWLINFLRNKLRITKQDALSKACWFVLDIGWKLRDESKI